MPLVPMPELLADAMQGGYAVGYFEAWDGYSLEAVVAAAEAERAPVILGFGCMLIDQGWLERGGIETLGGCGRRVAETCSVPVSLLLNEAHSLEHALRGIDAGFNAVMLCDGDVDLTARLVEAAHARGVAVEAELGHLPDGGPDGRVDGSHATLTDPDENRGR
jgi:fructose/tagatose bisphosphate aldolase